MTELEIMGSNAKSASKELINSGNKRNIALKNIAESLVLNCDKIINSNMLDLKIGKDAGLSDALLDRLLLNKSRIKSMADGIHKVIAMEDPIGKILSGHVTKDGLEIKKVSVPLGVIGIIYESRPNVTVDASCLCLKSGNSVILRGGKEAINTNICLVGIIREALKNSGLPENSVQLIKDTSRQSALELMSLNKYLDVLIPRGSANLINSVAENSKVPVIETGAGNCHIYVDKYADLDMAANIIFNAKTSRPSVCNSIETILVHKDIAKEALPKIENLLQTKDVELIGCRKTIDILGNQITPATEADWSREYLDYKLAVKVVNSLEEAIDHIALYSTGHSESIITSNYNRARKFTSLVDSAAVYVNASTRFTDGGQFGLGSEIGISTQKLHARGPMGINELTSTKFIILGDGQIR